MQSPGLLSPSAQTLVGPSYTRLVVDQPGNAETRVALAALDEEHLLAVLLKSRDDARAALAGLWLWHDFLDESHHLSQQIATSSGSFWHAIMHRREGEFSNSKYWYARCRAHPIFASLGVLTSQVVNPLPADRSLLRLTRSGFDPDVFVDLVQQAHQRPDDPLYEPLVRIQQIEWRLLFDHCLRAAAGL